MVNLSNRTLAKLFFLIILVSLSANILIIYKLDMVSESLPTGMATTSNVSINIQPPAAEAPVSGQGGGGGAARRGYGQGYGRGEERRREPPQPPEPPKPPKEPKKPKKQAPEPPQVPDPIDPIIDLPEFQPPPPEPELPEVELPEIELPPEIELIEFKLPSIEFPEYRPPVMKLTEEFKNSDISCLLILAKLTDILAAYKVPLDKRLVPRGFEPVISPFKMNCSGDSLDLTLNLPDNFNNLLMLRCREGVCYELQVEVSKEEFICGGEEIRELRLKQLESRVDYILPEELIKFPGEEKIITHPETSISSQEYKVEFLDSSIKDIEIMISSPAVRLPQPLNPSLRVIGTPLHVKIKESLTESVPARITIPIPVLRGFEIESLSIYYYSNSGWQPLGGEVDLKTNLINVKVENIFEYTVNNEAIFAIVGIKCASCPDAQLKKVYDPGTRNAIVLVHGFASSPETWQPFIDDMVLNKQDWQILTFAYPFAKTVSEIADEFSKLMELHSEEFDNVYIAAHSLGAFVVQDALHNSFNEGDDYVDKVKGVILVGSPNDGTPTAEIFENLFNFLMNKKLPYTLFNTHNDIFRELIFGKQVPKVPKIDYYVMAGSRTYEFNLGFFTITATELLEFTLPNDGITTTVGAQHVGGGYINNSCEDYFEVNLTHTELIDHAVPRRVIERVVNEELAKQNGDAPLVGYNQYLRFIIDQCHPEDTYLVVGKRIREEETKAPLNCLCGNGYCGEGEDETNCPIDCAEIDFKETFCFITPLLIYILLAITVVITSIVIAIENLRKGKKYLRTLRMIIYILLLLNLVLMILHYVICRKPLYTGYVILVFIVILDILDLLAKRKPHPSVFQEKLSEPETKKAERIERIKIEETPPIRPMAKIKAPTTKKRKKK